MSEAGSKPRVAFQGERGAFSEDAAIKLLGSSIELIPRPTFEAMFAAIADGVADLVLAPVENSLAGSVYRCYDLLLESGLTIEAEVTSASSRSTLQCCKRSNRRRIADASGGTGAVHGVPSNSCYFNASSRGRYRGNSVRRVVRAAAGDIRARRSPAAVLRKSMVASSSAPTPATIEINVSFCFLSEAIEEMRTECWW